MVTYTPTYFVNYETVDSSAERIEEFTSITEAFRFAQSVREDGGYADVEDEDGYEIHEEF